MLPWQFFSTAMSESGNSLVTNSSMISKVYFPRLVVPASSVVTSLVDFCVSAFILAVMMVFYRFVPGWEILALPLFVLLAFGAALGVGVWVSALMVRFRDFRIIVPFMVQFGLYLSPVGYSSGVVRERLAEADGLSEHLLLLYYLNPMASVIDGFRWSLLGGEHVVYWPGMALSAAIVVFVILTGVRYFRKTERTFADII
jgi:lipopolysaccharide transport system permease protein